MALAVSGWFVWLPLGVFLVVVVPLWLVLVRFGVLAPFLYSPPLVHIATTIHLILITCVQTKTMVLGPL